MKNVSGKLWGITLILAIGLAAVVYALGSQPKSSQQTLISPVVSPATSLSAAPSENVEQSGSRFVPYSQASYDAVASKKRVLYFHATWCPICKVVNEELTEKAEQIPSDIVVLRADYDSETELKKKYGVTYQHTFVQVDAEGKKVTAWNGGGVRELMANVK